MILDHVRASLKAARRDILVSLLAGIAGGGFVVLLALAVLRMGHSADWAAWAQAAGTVAAVFAAARIAARQSDDAAQREQRSARAHLMAASRLTTIFNVRVSAFLARCEEKGVDDRTINPILLRSLEASVKRLNRFPLDVLIDPTAVSYFTLALESADYILIWFTDTNALLERFPDQRAEAARRRLPDLKPLAHDLETHERALRRLAEPEWDAAKAQTE